jgi:acetyl-CoA carboxylase biotin carboxyl carrier protein
MAEVKAHITGTVWKIEAPAGTSVQAGDPIVILESMKMEMPVESPVKGTVREVKVAEGQPVNEGALVALVDEG